MSISSQRLPETMEVLFQGYCENKPLLESIAQLSSLSNKQVEHTVNVLSLTSQYCMFHQYCEADARRLGVSAMLHDIGCTEISSDLLSIKQKLTDSQYKEFQTHAKTGYKLIKKSTNFEPYVAAVALEHHERLDGSGYPNGSTIICEDAQLIGLIDSYVPIAYRGTSKYSQPKRAYDSLKVVKEEVKQGKFSKRLFVDFCSCLTH